MRNLLLTIVIVCAIVVTWRLADGQTGTTRNLATVETSTTVLDYQDRYEKGDQLDGRVRGVYGNLKFPGRCEGCSTSTARYSRLAPRRNSSPYEGITGRVYESFTLRNASPKEIIIEAGDSTPVPKTGEWHRRVRIDAHRNPNPYINPYKQVSEHNCVCGKGRACKCPPLVCEGDYCDTNYAIVFTSKKCSVCPQMWPVIKKLREDGYIVFYVETDNHPGILERLGIQVWPTTFVMENKRPKVRFRGVTTAEKIAEHLKTRKQQGRTNDKGTP